MRATRRGPFAEFIRLTRKAKGMSQADLASASGVARSTIIRWEMGQIAQPDPEHLAAVIEALGIPSEDAFRALGWLPEQAAPAERRFEDPDEQEIWEITSLSEGERMALIHSLRAIRSAS